MKLGEKLRPYKPGAGSGVFGQGRFNAEDARGAENSWVIARRQLPLRLDLLNSLVDGVLSLSPIDVWPIQNTWSFELKSGATEVPPGDPAFHDHYREVGPFPGADSPLTNKEILTRIYKAVGTPITPVL